MSWLDEPRIASGMRRQLDARLARLSAGERHVGWKVAFGPAMQAQVGIPASLHGYFTDANLVGDGAQVAIAGWVNPVLEPEIAVEIGDDGEIVSMRPAIELADLDTRLLGDLEAVLAGDVFHRHMILGPAVAPRTDITASVSDDTGVVAEIASVGELDTIVTAAAHYLGHFGERLRPGDVLMTGTLVPAIEIRPGTRYRLDCGPLGAVTVSCGR